MLLKLFFITAVLAIVPAITWADQDNTVQDRSAEILETIEAIDDIKPSQWGIRNGCISVNKIRNIRFLDDQLAVVYLRGKKGLLLRLRKECRGIKDQNFSYEVRGGQLCPRFDRFILAKSGIPCEIETIQPYVKLPIE